MKNRGSALWEGSENIVESLDRVEDAMNEIQDAIYGETDKEVLLSKSKTHVLEALQSMIQLRDLFEAEYNSKE